jgi:hypothetical protein
MLIRHLLCILCYIGIIQYYCYILLFYCYIVWCVYITQCIHIFNHCNDLALNGSLIGNKHIATSADSVPSWRKRSGLTRGLPIGMYPTLTWSFLETKKFDSQSPTFLCKLCNIIERKIIILLTDKRWKPFKGCRWVGDPIYF